DDEPRPMQIDVDAEQAEQRNASRARGDGHHPILTAFCDTICLGEAATNEEEMTVNGSLTMPDLSRSPTVDQVGIEERVDRLTKRSIKKDSKVFALKLALSMIDLTTLEGADSPGKVRQMCYKAAHLADALPDIPLVAAVSVYPTLVKIAKEQVNGTGVKVAAVA